MAAQDLSDKLVVMGVSTEAANLIEANFNNYPAKDANGNISANVNLRSGTLNSQMALAGGTSEIGYATDTNALVRFNGNAGQAQVLNSYANGSTLNFTLNASNIADLTNPTSGVYIDCNNISYLIVKIDPSIQLTSNNYTNLNIRLPNSLSIPSFRVFIQQTSANFWNPNNTEFTLAYQVTDPLGALGYNAIAADLNLTKPRFAFGTYVAIDITFLGPIAGDGGNNAVGWTRLPVSGEGAFNFSNKTFASIGTTINATATAQTLTSGTVASSSALTLTPGMWLMTGFVNFNVTSAVVATEMIAGISLASATSAPSVSATTSVVRTTENLPTAGNITMAIPPIIGTAIDLTTIKYGNARATFTAGTIIATVYQRAIRIG